MGTMELHFRIRPKIAWFSSYQHFTHFFGGWVGWGVQREQEAKHGSSKYSLTDKMLYQIFGFKKSKILCIEQGISGDKFLEMGTTLCGLVESSDCLSHWGNYGHYQSDRVYYLGQKKFQLITIFRFYEFININTQKILHTEIISIILIYYTVYLTFDLGTN